MNIVRILTDFLDFRWVFKNFKAFLKPAKPGQGSFPFTFSWFPWFPWFYLISQRPTFQFSGSGNFARIGFSWSRSEINLFAKGTRKVEKQTSSRARWKDILKHLPICVIFPAFGTKRWKVEGAYSAVQRPRDTRQKTFFSTWALCSP